MPIGASASPACGSWLLAGQRLGIDNLLVIASSGDPAVPWEHVSVSVSGARRCPTWEEMDAVKRLFWADDETVMQLHVPRTRPPGWTVA